MKRIDKYLAPAVAGLAFALAFCFFAFLYPSHLFHREQMSLFLFDGSFIADYFKSPGWLSHLCGDFLTQFFFYISGGPLVLACLLTLIGVLAYATARRFTGRWLSLGIAAVFYIWSFFRECGLWYDSSYTVAVAGILALVLAVVQLRKPLHIVAACLLAGALGFWCLGSPVAKVGGSFWNRADFRMEKILSTDVAASRGDWDKVLEITGKEDLHVNTNTYYYNLANARRGRLSEDLMQYYQPFSLGLFLPVNSRATQFEMSASGEVWYWLGDLTMAEHSTILSLIFSPKHTGSRYIRRLAEINLIKGDEAAAMKYLGMLSKTLPYREWALARMPESHEPWVETWLENCRRMLPKEDFVHVGDDSRVQLRALVEADENNIMAQEYLLCCDLLVKDLESFISDWSEHRLQSRLYQEACLIWLAYTQSMTPESVREYEIPEQVLAEFADFTKTFEQTGGSVKALENRYSRTYWFFFQFAHYKNEK